MPPAHFSRLINIAMIPMNVIFTRARSIRLTHVRCEACFAVLRHQILVFVMECKFCSKIGSIVQYTWPLINISFNASKNEANCKWKKRTIQEWPANVQSSRKVYYSLDNIDIFEETTAPWLQHHVISTLAYDVRPRMPA